MSLSLHQRGNTKARHHSGFAQHVRAVPAGACTLASEYGSIPVSRPDQWPGTYFRQLCCSLKPSTSRALRLDSGASNSPIGRVIGVLGQFACKNGMVGVLSVM